LTPAIADVRRAVRAVLPDEGLVFVALSGGADSLALAAATACEVARARHNVRAGAIVIDHGLQTGSEKVAERAIEIARALTLDPLVCRRVQVAVGPAAQTGGLEAAARSQRYAVFASVAAELGARHILLGHTMDDQAETVLLGLARGSGPTSMRGMARVEGIYVRPLLSIRRKITRQFCFDSGLPMWDDPHNDDAAFTRVRVRKTVMPTLERELGPGIAEALARTAELLREDSVVLDAWARERATELIHRSEEGVTVAVDVLAATPVALRYRVIRLVVYREFSVTLERDHTLAVAGLMSNWHGQKWLDLPGVRVVRRNGKLIFQAAGDRRASGARQVRCR
jgi:tRNA(Ile)-lysidine synthase